jgi:hypothetical protein
VRNHNNLPANNGGFGKNFVTTHLHNGHTPAESDGNPCDYFTPGQFYDQHYPNVLAGVNSTHQATAGDIQESMSTLWYHESNNIRWTSWSCLPLRVTVVSNAQAVQWEQKQVKTPRERLAERSFPNVTLTTHKGKKVKFYGVRRTHRRSSLSTRRHTSLDQAGSS